MQHGDPAGMKMDGPGKMNPGTHDMGMGEKIFSGKVGPWSAEARLVDMKAQMEKSGVSGKTAARYAGMRHLMLFLTDPATGKHAAGVAGKVAVTGPDKASSSTVTARRDGRAHRRGRRHVDPGEVHVQGGDRIGREEGERHVSVYVEIVRTDPGRAARFRAPPVPPREQAGASKARRDGPREH